MPSFPVGPGSVQGPLSPGGTDETQESQKESGQHGHRKVSEATPEKRILVRPKTSPQKKLSEFGSVKAVTPESSQVKQTKPLTPTQERESQPQGLDVRQGDDRYQSRADIIRNAKRNKTWQQLEKQIEKKGGATSKKGFKKLVASMPGMDFSNKRVVSLLALFAIDKFDSGKFTEAQMGEYMGAFMEGYTQAKADEQVQQALLMLPPPPKRGVKTVGHSLNRVAVLAEIAAMTSEKSKSEDATAAAFKNMKTDLQADLYDRNNEFLTELTASLEPQVVEINRKVALGMEREMKRLMVEEGGSKKRKLSPPQQQTMVNDVDLMVRQFVESQLREKKQKIDQYSAEGRPIDAITDSIMQKASARRAGMIEVLVRNAGPGLKDAFEQHSVPESFQPEHVLDRWLIGNGTKTAEPEQTITAETTRVEKNSDEPVHELEVWAQQLLQLVPGQYHSEVDIEQLRKALLDKAIQLDVADGLLQSEFTPSPFSRQDPLRRAVRRKPTNAFAPVKPKTVTETLEVAIKTELAKRAARRVEEELEISGSRPDPKPVGSEKTSTSQQKTSDSDVEPSQTETSGTRRFRARKLDGDGLVPKLVRQFERIVEHERQQMEQSHKAAVSPGRFRRS